MLLQIQLTQILFDSRLGQISLSTVKNILGNPAYNAKYNGQEIIGYTAGKEYKILFVFVQSTKDSNYYILDHYSVLYPEGTVNNMGNDPGRQWWFICRTIWIWLSKSCYTRG